MNHWEPLFPHMTELPGSHIELISHPYYYPSIAIEIAIIQQHRFAFYYWAKWTHGLPYQKFITKSAPPTLISFDWHQDLACIQDPVDLEKLESDDLQDVALFTWFRLNPFNDNHIRSAAYLNMIGDIYLLTKQGYKEQSYNTFNDKFGNIHHIYTYKKFDELLKTLLKSDTEVIYFDIDLDYFIESDDVCGDKVKGISSEEEILSLLDISSDFMQWIFPRLGGMTIATEPKWCGGIANSNYILNVINYGLFESSLLSKKGYWRHQKSLEEEEEE
jgi:hypothetical protein